MPAALIDSLHNDHVTAARALQRRKGRVAAGLFLVEGPHAVEQALVASAHRLTELFVTPAAARREAVLLDAAAAAGAVVRLASERVLTAIGDTVTPQGMVGVARLPATSLDAAIATGTRLAVILDLIADPGNAGTVIRTADAAGADAVVATEGSVDLWSGKCVRSSAGSIFHTPMITGVSTAAALAAARSAGLRVLATAADGSAELDGLIDDGALAGPTAWVFGNEAHGLSDEARAGADQIVRLPVYGRAESLNLAAAAAICLYASARAHRR
jgi:TrmH family RNA methyltransferase